MKTLIKGLAIKSYLLVAKEEFSEISNLFFLIAYSVESLLNISENKSIQKASRMKYCLLVGSDLGRASETNGVYNGTNYWPLI